MALQAIRRIGVLSLAKVLAATYAGLGLLIGGVLSVISVVGGVLGAAITQDAGGLAGMLFGLAAVIVLPIVYGLVGFVTGLVIAPLYNLVARAVGGIEVELS